MTAHRARGWLSQRAQRRQDRATRREAAAVAQRPRMMRDLPRSLAGARQAALWIIAAVVFSSTLSAFAESYRGLYDWFVRHDFPRSWALAAPLMIDSFVLVGELALFIALLDQWPDSARRWPWTVALTGLGISVLGNIGHITSPLWTSRATAAVPPLAAAAGLTVGLGVLRRIVDNYRPATAAPGAAPDLAPLAVIEQDRRESAARAALLAPGALPVNASSADHDGDGAEREHRAALAGAGSDAARIRYARQVTGERTPGALVAWLADRGHAVNVVNAATVVRRQDGQPPRVLRLADHASGRGGAS